MKPVIIFTIVALAIMLIACSSEGPSSSRMPLVDLVTVENCGDNTPTVFTFQRYDDSPVITLTCRDSRIDASNRGKRVLITYYPVSGQPYTSGDIDLAGMSRVNHDTVRVESSRLAGWDTTPVYLNSMWRTGRYLNLRLRVENSSKPRRFALVADSATVGSEEPQLYLVHDKLGAPESYMMETYVSFDIEPVWGLASCRAIAVHVNDTNLPDDLYIFEKSVN